MRVSEALDACGLAGFETRAVSELSGGELQRVALAGVLAMRPRYLVLDEVTSQLDEASRAQVRSIVRRMVDAGIGALLISHDVEEMAAAERVVVMSSGHVAWEGVPGELFRDDRASQLASIDHVAMGKALCLLATQGLAFGRTFGEDEIVDTTLESGLSGEVAELLKGGSSKEVPIPVVARGSGAALVARDVTVRYGDEAALDGVTLAAASGRVLLVAGRSGSGKSTLAGVLTGVLEPDEGAAMLDGKPVRPGMVGLCQQRAENQLFCETVLEDARFGPRNLGADEGEADVRARAALRDLGVGEGLWNRSPFALSGGQRRRVALAGVVAMRPGAFVFDEPTNGLDAEGREQLHAAVRSLAASGAAVVVISHDVGEWLRAADDVALLADGRVTWHGPAARLRCDKEPFAAAGMRVPLDVAILCRLQERPIPGGASAGAGLDREGAARAGVARAGVVRAGVVRAGVARAGLARAGLARKCYEKGSKVARQTELTDICVAFVSSEGLGGDRGDGDAPGMGAGDGAASTPETSAGGAAGTPETSARGAAGTPRADAGNGAIPGAGRRRSPLLGAYHAADTPLHRLDARVKLACLLAVTVALFAAHNPAALAAMAAAVLVAARLGGLTARELAQGLRPAAIILAFSLLANAFVADGTGDLALAGPLGVSYAGLARGAIAVSRIAVLVFAALVLSATTSSTAVADALASAMAPLERLGVPTGDIAMTVSIALRFIPLTAEELVRIRDAQRARGVDFSAGPVTMRVARWLSVLAPLVVALFRRADDLAQAMAERCYRGRGRTRLVRPLRPSDLLVLAAVIIGCIVCAIL